MNTYIYQLVLFIVLDIITFVFPHSNIIVYILCIFCVNYVTYHTFPQLYEKEIDKVSIWLISMWTGLPALYISCDYPTLLLTSETGCNNILAHSFIVIYAISFCVLFMMFYLLCYILSIVLYIYVNQENVIPPNNEDVVLE